MTLETADLLVRRIGRLSTPVGRRPLAGGEVRIQETPACAVSVKKGRVRGVYPDARIPKGLKAAREFDAEGRLATPGFVDPHTHLVFSGSRHDEYEMRIRGTPYLEIARRGGGIRSTVAAVREADNATLSSLAAGRLRRMLREGTCTVEIKSGYGLDLATELRLLRIVQSLAKEGGMKIVPTFLGAHAVPPEFDGDRAGYVDLVTRTMLPAVADGKLARFCDVFCESGAFSPEESRTILEAARGLGLGLKMHAEQFSRSGGARLAGEMSAVSADHLGAVSEEDAAFLAEKGVVAVLLPGSALTAGTPPFPYARLLLEKEVPVALATDCNPGTSFLDSMPLAWSLACSLYRMTPAEGLAGATLNAACAVGLGDETGSVEEGKRADIVLWDAEDFREVPYRFGRVPIREVFCKGKPVFSDLASMGDPATSGSLRLWIDGAARGNPGPASAGVVIEDESGRVLLDEGFALGETTNNVAEYSALIHALEHAERLGGRALRIHSDSELLVKQMKGQYKVRHANLQPLHARAKEGIARFEAVEIVHVRREQNRRADAAANRALDNR